MRQKPLRAAMFGGTLFVAGGALLYQPLLGSSLPIAHLASATGSMLVAVRQWIQLALAHASPAQLVEGVAVAWFIFVLTLLLLTHTDRAEPLDRESSVHVWPGDEQTGDTPPRRFSVNPPVPHIAAPPGLPALYRSLLELPYAALDNVPTESPKVSLVKSNPVGLNNGHLLALTGIAAAERRRMFYGLFLVAEFMGATSDSGGASQRTVDVIASQVAPLLANDTMLASEHLSALFEMAILRATYVLRHNGIGTAADLRALVAGIMVMGNDVYVVNVGHCRAYLFRHPDRPV